MLSWRLTVPFCLISLMHSNVATSLHPIITIPRPLPIPMPVPLPLPVLILICPLPMVAIRTFQRPQRNPALPRRMVARLVRHAQMRIQMVRPSPPPVRLPPPAETDEGGPGNDGDGRQAGAHANPDDGALGQRGGLGLHLVGHGPGEVHDGGRGTRGVGRVGGEADGDGRRGGGPGEGAEAGGLRGYLAGEFVVAAGKNRTVSCLLVRELERPGRRTLDSTVPTRSNNPGGTSPDCPLRWPRGRGTVRVARPLGCPRRSRLRSRRSRDSTAACLRCTRRRRHRGPRLCR